jgi:hypothetical protein
MLTKCRLSHRRAHSVTIEKLEPIAGLQRGRLGMGSLILERGMFR